jgi:hypothetical protein
VIGNTSDFCTATNFTNNLLPLLDYGGVFFISDGSISREVQQYGGSTSTTFEQHGTCVACPTPVPTSTPVPDPTSTPVPPPTSTPVPPPTATPDQTPNWQNLGSTNCYGTCNTYHVQYDFNSDSPTYGQTRQGGLITENSTDCGGCCGQSTAANWVNESTNCDGFTLYNVQRDTNGCSATYNQTRR